MRTDPEKRRKQCWKRWYAWYPVRLDEPKEGGVMVWLEWIERQRMTNRSSWYWYRDIECQCKERSIVTKDSSD